MKKGIGIVMLVIASVFVFTACNTRTFANTDELEPTRIEKVNNFDGVTMTIKEGSVSSTEITVIIENDSSTEFFYVPLFSLEVCINGKWYEVPVINEITYDMALEVLQSGDRIVIEDNFEMLYGSLGRGKYRSTLCLKEDNTGSGESDYYFLAAEFEIDGEDSIK